MSYCPTKAFELIEGGIIFEVENLPNLEDEAWIQSPTFELRSKLHSTEWNLIIGTSFHNTDKYVLVYLMLGKSHFNEPVSARPTLRCLNSNWECIKELFQDSTKCRTQFHIHSEIVSVWGKPNFILLSEILDPKKFPDKKVIFECKISVHRKLEDETKEISNTLKAQPQTQSLGLWDMFTNQEFTDVTLKVDSETLRCHKNVLAVGSPVFKTMFQNDLMIENNTVEIEEYSLKCVKKLLEYLYKRKVSKIEDVTCELLVAADYYQVSELVEICEDQLLLQISAENVLEVLQVAERCRRLRLISKGVEYLAANRGLLETPEYENMLRNDANLAVLITKELLK